MSSEPTKAHCTVHPDQALDFVCMKDCALCCAKCRDEERGAHKICGSVVPLASVEAAKIRDEFLSKAVGALKEQQHSIEASDRLIDALSERQDKFDRDVEAIRESIQATFSSIREAIDVKEHALLTQLEEIASKSKYGELGTKLRMMGSNNAMSALIESAESTPDDVKELVAKVGEVRQAVEDSKKVINEACKAALSSTTISFSFEGAEKIREKINESGKLTVNESFLLGNFESSNPREDKLDLNWTYNNDSVLSAPITYCVESRERDMAPSGFEVKYIGEECRCTVTGLSKGPAYDFRLQVKFGDLLSGPLSVAVGSINQKYMARNGVIYCGGDIDNFCMCGRNCRTCGEGGTGCQCFDCFTTQECYMGASHPKCPKGHILLIGSLSSAKSRIKSPYKNLVCSICWKEVEVTNRNMSFCSLTCKECSFFVCNECVPRVCPTKDNEFLEGVILTELEPLPVYSKRYTDCGSIYCKGPLDKCVCGHCDGVCRDRCSCNGCVDELRGIYTNAHLKCKKGHELQILEALERKSRFFKTVCDVCGDPINMYTNYGHKLILSCQKCNYDICPRCVKKMIPKEVIPPYVLVEPERDYSNVDRISAPK